MNPMQYFNPLGQVPGYPPMTAVPFGPGVVPGYPPMGGYPGAPQNPQPAPPANPQPQQAQPQPAQNRAPAQIVGMWIDDAEELDSYSVQQGVPLVGWFRGADVIVMRTVGDDGRTHDRYLDYTERPDARENQIDPSQFVTKEDFGILVREIKAMRDRMGYTDEVRGGGSDAAV